MKANSSYETLANLYQNILRHTPRNLGYFYSHQCERHRSHSVNRVCTYVHTNSITYDCIIDSIMRCSVLNYIVVPEKRYSKIQWDLLFDHEMYYYCLNFKWTLITTLNI
jgi:hypothetical protein